MRCCDRPHGNNVFLAMIFTSIAIILSSTANRCDFAHRQSDTQSLALPFLSASNYVGLWSYESSLNGYCTYYPVQYISAIDNGNFYASRFFNVWASVAGFVILVTMFVASCVGLSRGIWITMGFFLLINTVAEGLSFLFLSSVICNSAGTTCSLGRGGRCCIAAIVFWFVASISVAAVPPPKRNYSDAIEEKTTTTETVAPDGTKTVTTKVEKVAVPGGGM